MKLIDLHLHSSCSADGSSIISDYARAAGALGLAEIGFCEHADFDPRDRDYGYLDLARYDSEVQAGRGAVVGVRLRQGIEITYQAAREGEIRSWLTTHAWDYVVASVHLVEYCDGWAIVSDRRVAEGYFATLSERQAYLPYFEELLRAARSGVGDLLGHFDLVRRYGTLRYGPFDPTRFQEEIREVLRAAVDAGTGLEINTSGLRQPPGDFYPSLAVLRWYRELGGEILTTGSDAHGIDDLGAGIAQAYDLARLAGFRAVATFEGRRPCWIDL